MRVLKLVVPVTIAFAGLVISTTATYGKPEYAKKEKKSCTFCHAKVEAKDAMEKNLNDAGKYYKAHDHSLDGYKGK